MEAVSLFWVGLAVVAGIAANARGRNGVAWALLGLLVSGVLALTLVVCLPDLNVEREKAAVRKKEQAEALDSKVCPRCAETIKRAAKVCRHCGHEFASEQQVTLPSFTGPDPQLGARAKGRAVHRALHGRIAYVTHEDGLVIARIAGTPYTWQSVDHFQRWADANPTMLEQA